MKTIRAHDGLKPAARPSVVTIGNFDGVHVAHRQVIRGVVKSARSAGAAAAVVTFDPHPATILRPGNAPRLLTSLDQKIALIQELDVELLVVIPFTRAISELNPEQFVREILVQALRPLAVHVGPNFRFGHGQAGDVRTLAKLGAEAGFEVVEAPLVEIRGERVSSSRIRRLLAEGRVTLAGRLLGRPYSSVGAIVPGRGVGKKLTVPTLNLAPIEELLPSNGVYVSRTRVGGRAFESVTNVGVRPTFGEDRITVESFLLKFSGAVRGAEMEVEYLYRLRDEKKFPDAVALKAQIERDARRAKRFFELLLKCGERKGELASSLTPPPPAD